MVTLQNAKLHHYDGLGSKTATYVVYGFVDVEDSIDQTTIQLNAPGASKEKAILNPFFGQKGTNALSLVILPRTDDYTDGTGSPTADADGNYGVWQQKTFLENEIMKPGGYHVLENEIGQTIKGRIESLRIRRTGDDPVGMNAQGQFKEGEVVGTF